MIFVSKNGTKWYLHTKKVVLPRNKVEATAYYFKREKGENYYEGELPARYTVIETSTGLPLVKKL